MSNNNPYATNGYNSGYNPSSQPSQNPYAANNPYAGARRYADPYAPANNESSTSVNSHGSREARRRREDGRPPPQSQPSHNRSPQRGQSPGPITSPPTNPYEQLNRRPSPGPDERGGYGPGPRSERRGYGGLGPLTPDYERQQPPPARPTTAGRDRDRGRAHDEQRERAYSDGRTRERRGGLDPRDMPPTPALPLMANLSSPAPGAAPSQPGLNSTNHSGGRQQPSDRGLLKNMDEILKHIQTGWKVMEGDECVPVRVALQLADPSSLGLGHRDSDFARTHVDLQKSLKTVVNEHYADFNSAVGTYHKIQASIRESQSRVRYLKNGLTAVKDGMLSTRPELRGLAQQSGELDQLLSILNQMEALKEMPGKLEEKINEKRWIGAVEVLDEALRVCRKGELDGIGAMADLRSYFTGQETSLVDMLVEELHDHLYLKSPYCADRWKGRKADGAEADAKQVFTASQWNRPVYRFLSALDAEKPFVEDASRNPETDTFYYIQTTIEALRKLNYLEEAIGRIEERMPVELYKVVERTNLDVDAKHPAHLRAPVQPGKGKLTILQPNDSRSQVLSDFLYTLYAKFEAIAEGHRVLHDVVRGIIARDKLPDADSYTTGFKELWKLYQMEMRSILHDYLATENDVGGAGGMVPTSTQDVFSRRPRDKTRPVFRLADMDEKSAELRTEEEELDQILKTSVPGLVTKTRGENGVGGNTDRPGPDGSVAGHKLLVEPSVFNMTVLLGPSLVFLQQLKEIVPMTSNIPISTLTSFLDDFLINVFHPQFEEAVAELCANTMVDVEAFLEDNRWRKHAPHPIFRGTVAFMSLVRAFSMMLNSIPQDQMFTQLVVTQLLNYYDKCHRFFKSIVTRSTQDAPNSNTTTQTMKAAAGFAETGEVSDAATSLWGCYNARTSGRKELVTTEIQQLIAATKASPIQAYDIISDSKSVHQLSLVYNSMRWLAASLLQVRSVGPSRSGGQGHSRNTSAAGGGGQPNPRRWTLIASLKTTSSAPEDEGFSSVATPRLPLTSETVIPFDETLSSFRQLAQLALLTLHVDVRCNVIYQLGRSLKPIETIPDTAHPASAGPGPGNNGSVRDSSLTQQAIDSGMYPFVLPTPPNGASPRVLELNHDLINFDANIGAYLGVEERKFILAGLGRLVDRYLVVGADLVQVMNQEGAERMQVDGMVVQQVLRGLGVHDVSTMDGHRRQYYHLHNGVEHNEETGLGIATGTKDDDDGGVDQKDGEDEGEEEETVLGSSSRYYELFLQGPDAIMAYVKEKKSAQPPEDVGYTYDELRTLIELSLSSHIRGHDREEAIRSRKRMGDLLLQLGEVMWDS